MRKSEGAIKLNIVMVAILAITIIECVALCNGINGTLQKLSMTMIAGLVGLVLPTPKVLG